MYCITISGCTWDQYFILVEHKNTQKSPQNFLIVLLQFPDSLRVCIYSGVHPSWPLNVNQVLYTITQGSNVQSVQLKPDEREPLSVGHDTLPTFWLGQHVSQYTLSVLFHSMSQKEPKSVE